MRLTTRWWRHVGKMTTYLPVLLLLDLGVPGPASALQFDTYSVSGFIAPGPFSGLGGTASVTGTAPDFRLSLNFSASSFEPAIEFVSFGCSTDFGAEIPCRPGLRVGGRAQAFFSSDIGTTAVLAGQEIPKCTLTMHPTVGFGHLCVAAGHTVLSWGSAVVPPFAGPPPGHPVPDVLANITTVASTFSAEFGATLWDSSGLGNAIRLDSFGFTGTGPAQFVLEWQADIGAWRPLFAEGRFDVAPIPEPATLLLVGTTAAGLGLARWYRRRTRGHEYESSNVP
jgi:hypothetical protein